jgi:hypothetical protein
VLTALACARESAPDRLAAGFVFDPMPIVGPRALDIDEIVPESSRRQLAIRSAQSSRRPERRLKLYKICESSRLPNFLLIETALTSRQLFGRASRSHQIDHLSPELRRTSSWATRRQTPENRLQRCPQSRVNSNPLPFQTHPCEQVPLPFCRIFQY